MGVRIAGKHDEPCLAASAYFVHKYIILYNARYYILFPVLFHVLESLQPKILPFEICHSYQLNPPPPPSCILETSDHGTDRYLYHYEIYYDIVYT